MRDLETITTQSMINLIMSISRHLSKILIQEMKLGKNYLSFQNTTNQFILSSRTIITFKNLQSLLLIRYQLITSLKIGDSSQETPTKTIENQILLLTSIVLSNL